MVESREGDTRCVSREHLSSPPPCDGTVAQSARDKANLLAKHFTDKMCISAPDKPPPPLPNIVKEKLSFATTSEVAVKAVLLKLDVTKAVGSDNISHAFFASVPMYWLAYSPQC